MVDHNGNMDPQVSALLSFHERRREEGLPTVSVLVGAEGVAARSWQHWATEAGYRPAIHPRDGIEHLVPRLVEQIRTSCDLPRLALNALLQRAGRPLTASTSPLAPLLDGRTRLDLDALADTVLAEPDPSGAAAAAHEICRLALQGALASPALAERLDARLADRVDPPRWRALRALDEMLPLGACPAVLLAAPSNDASAAKDSADNLAPLDAVARSLANFVQTVPTWAVAMTLSPAELGLYQRKAADSQTKSLLITGVVVLPVTPARRGREGHEPDRRDTPVSPVPSTLRKKAGPPIPEDKPDPIAVAIDAARSEAERLLFQMLENNSITRGHFVLNGAPGFKFRSRQAEVDLLASGLGLAVEIDGYFHFLHSDAYRRDREKDWVLQKNGYTIIRVLAEDVPARMEKVLDFIVSVVEHRRGVALKRPQ